MSKFEDSIGKLILDLYLPVIKVQFEHHPNKEEIITKLTEGTATIQEIDRWFSEAEYWALKHLTQLLKDKPIVSVQQGKAYVVFRVFDKKRGNE